MKLFELIGLIAFALFVTNCFQFEKVRKHCEETSYEEKVCETHKKIKEASEKKLKISFE